MTVWNKWSHWLKVNGLKSSHDGGIQRASWTCRSQRALQQATSRGDVPNSFSHLRQAPVRVCTEWQEERLRLSMGDVAQLDGPKSHGAHRSGTANMHTIPPHVLWTGLVRFKLRLLNFHFINWNDIQLLSNSCLSHYCWETAAKPQVIARWKFIPVRNWSKYKGTAFVVVPEIQSLRSTRKVPAKIAGKDGSGHG